MKTALISDIHGNLVALEAVLTDLSRESLDRVVCLGDVAATGPQPHETVQRLHAIGCPVVMGNTDALLLAPQTHEATVEQLKGWGMSEESADAIATIDIWCTQVLTAADLDYMRTFRETIDLSLGGGATLLCFHGSPRSNTEVIVSTTPDEQLEAMLSGFGATVLAGGHTHAQMLRRLKDRVIINPGSVGLPYEILPSGQARSLPWAEWALIDHDDGGMRVEFRRAPFDVGAVVAAALRSGMPAVEWWTKGWTRK